MNSDTKQIVITVDKDIPHPGSNAGKRVTTLHTLYHDKLKGMATGDSFFVEGKTREDLQPMPRYAKRIGVKLSALDTDEDEVYMVPGVRVWRVKAEGGLTEAFEQTFAEIREGADKHLAVASGVSYWRNTATGEVRKLADGALMKVESRVMWELVNEKTWIEYQSNDL